MGVIQIVVREESFFYFLPNERSAVSWLASLEGVLYIDLSAPPLPSPVCAVEPAASLA